MLDAIIISDILYYGLDPRICGFVAQQEGIGKFVVINPPNRATYDQVIRLACESDAATDAWWPFLGAADVIPLSDLRVTHVTAERHRSGLFHRANMEVNRRLIDDWGEVVRLRFDNLASVLVQPYSLDNVSVPEHWPHWLESLEWLKEAGVRVVLAGKAGFLDDYEGRHVLNLTGQTESMEDVFALAEVCQGVVTTSNALSMWTALRGIEALVMPNSRITQSAFFQNWITENTRRNYVLGHQTTLDHFEGMFRNYWTNRRLFYYEGYDD